jgi:hypothetical protein
MFAGFEPHRQFRTAAAVDRAEALANLPFAGDTWSEDPDLSDRGSLRHLNALLRSKLLVRLSGRSDALVVDFSPPAAKGGTPAPYQLALAHRGHEHHPLDLSFPSFVEAFERFGGASWYLASLSPAALATLNVDPVPTVEADLAPFAGAYPREVEAVVARARRNRDAR